MSSRPPVSKEFIRASVCERIVNGTARVVSEKGYQAATVGDIVKSCGTARNTFYECFGGKEEACLAMVSALGIDELGQSHSIDVLLIEVTAMHHAGEARRASEYLLRAEEMIRFFAEAELKPRPSSDDPREGTLPPGRHGLPPEFIVANQRARLLSAIAAAIVKRGWLGTRICDVSEGAATSRRTFYEQFGNLEVLTRVMAAEYLPPTDLLDDHPCNSGLFAVAVEALAERICEGDSPTAGKALGAVYALVATFEGVPA